MSGAQRNAANPHVWAKGCWVVGHFGRTAEYFPDSHTGIDMGNRPLGTPYPKENSDIANLPHAIHDGNIHIAIIRDFAIRIESSKYAPCVLAPDRFRGMYIRGESLAKKGPQIGKLTLTRIS